MISYSETYIFPERGIVKLFSFCADDTSCVQDETIKSSLSEHDSKKAHGVDESQDGIGSIPTPCKTKETRKRRNDGNDMNKKPSQRQRMKKHRPKIFDESKPKKVPKAQTPRVPKSKPKTPKPTTPYWEQERRMQSRKKEFTASTSCHIEDLGHDVQEASRSSIVIGSSKRCLDFDGYSVDKEPQSHEEPPVPGFEKFDCFFGKIVTSKRNTPRRSKFLNKSLKASDELLGDDNKQQHAEDKISTRNQEQVDTHGRKYVNFYQRRKKINSNSANPIDPQSANLIPTVQVYQRLYRGNQCLQYSKKCGPNFPKLFKKQRTARKKVNIKINHWYIIAKSLVKRLHRKNTQSTRENVQNRVNKSKDKKRVVKPNPYTDELLPVFLHPPRRKRSIRHTYLRESVTDFPYDFQHYLLCQGGSSLQITKCLSLQDVPVQRINSFTSPQQKCQRFDNSIRNPNWLQLQEVVVLESQSLPLKEQDISHTIEGNEADVISILNIF